MLEIIRYENKRLKEMFINGEAKVGDIVVWSSPAEVKGNDGRPRYELLGEECPNMFHSKLSCSTKPGGRLSLYRVGTVYCNAFGSEVQIRKATEEEKELNKELSQIHRRELRKIGRTSLLKLAKDTYGD